MSIIPEQSLELLQSTALAYMATIGPKGEPQVSAVWFTWDGAHLLFALNKGRQKYRNLLREPRVAIAIADPANPYHALEIRGTVARIDEDPQRGQGATRRRQSSAPCTLVFASIATRRKWNSRDLNHPLPQPQQCFT